MNYQTLAKSGVRNALATALYVLVVVSVMSNNESFLPGKPEIAAGMFMLLLFIISALVTSSLVLWQPLKLLVDGKKQEAGVLLCITGATLVAVLAAVLIVLLIR